MIQNVWQSITSFVYTAVKALIDVLPDSPFSYLAANAQIYQILKYVNWLVPVNYILSSMAAWLSAITIYYVYSIIMRWVKAID